MKIIYFRIQRVVVHPYSGPRILTLQINSGYVKTVGLKRILDTFNKYHNCKLVSITKFTFGSVVSYASGRTLVELIDTNHYTWKKARINGSSNVIRLMS